MRMLSANKHIKIFKNCTFYMFQLYSQSHHQAKYKNIYRRYSFDTEVTFLKITVYNETMYNRITTNSN